MVWAILPCCAAEDVNEGGCRLVLTLVGVIELLIGLGLFLFGSLNSLFVLTIIATLFGGSAALFLPALGGSSITPATLSLLFLIPRILAPGSSQFPTMIEAVKANRWLIIFVLYGILAAYVMPRLFGDQIAVTPMRGRTRERYASQLAYLFAVEPLRPSAQNLTTSVYMTGSMMVSIAACTLMMREGAGRLFAKIAGIVGVAHALLGIVSVFLKDTPVDVVFDLFRNGSYAQLDQAYNGFVRMRGVWPEASSYATFAIVWFVFNFECWLRRIQPGWAGAATLLLGAALLMSTSTTAYFGLAVFGLLLSIRVLVSPRLASGNRIVFLALFVFIAFAGTLATMMWKPTFANDVYDLVKHMTVDKPDSFSGKQRRFWAEQGVHAFVTSYGLGIGPGSFRSSSLATAILGSTGIIGTLAFGMHMLQATSPLRRSTYVRVASDELNVAGAASWAILIAFMALSISWPSCDPGIEIALLGGAVIGLRHRKPVPNIIPNPEPPAAAEIDEKAESWRPSFPPRLTT